MADIVNINDLRRLSIDDLTKLLNEGYIEKKEAWKDLLEILKNEDEASELGHYFFRERGTDDFKDDSLIDYIQRRSDLDDEAFSDLLTRMKNNQNLSIWNQSLNTAIRYFLNHIDINDLSKIIPGTNDKIKYEDVWYADAGRYFIYDDKRFVFPWWNVDNNSYVVVRSGDEIKAVIEDSSNLQFTRSQNGSASKWIRLIMPKYERYVEIEDLDRNFWVIGQVVTAISAYLFDDDGPIRKMIKSLLQEITELWENILYLWAALAVYDTKVYTDVHVEVCYVPNDEQYTQYKYDNFTQSYSWSDLCDIFQYKIQEYPESNLIIIPIRRLKNYYHNYYKEELYPGMLFYDRNNPLYVNEELLNNGFRILSFKDVDNNETGRIKFSTEIQEIIYGAKDNGDGTLDVIFPYKDIATTPEINAGLYYGAIRTVPTLKNDWWSYDVDNGFSLSGFELKCYDAIAEAVAENDTEPTIICQKILTTPRFYINEEVASSSASDKRIKRSLSDTITQVAYNSGTKIINKGYYLGELASNRAKTKEITYTIKDVEVTMPPITSTDTNGKVYYYDVNKVKEKIRNKNVEILKEYYKDVDSHKDTQIKLLVGTRVFDIYKEEFTTNADKKEGVVKATSKDGLGGYYTTSGIKKLYSREDLKSGFDNCLYDETTETTLARDYPDIDITYKNDNEYKLPYAIYSVININNYSFKANDISNNANAFSKNIGTLLDRYNATKFTGSHGGRIDLGAQLVIPGISTEIYDNYEGFRVLPTLIPFSENDNGQHPVWLEGETGGPKRHTWNDSTTMVYIKNGETDIKEDNWAIVFIKTYGGYAPSGALNQGDRHIYRISSIRGYKEANTSSPHGDFYPIVFSVHTHIFLPNGVYAKHTREFWTYRSTTSRPSAETFEWNSNGTVSTIGDFNNIMENKLRNNYVLKSHNSSYTQYVNNKRQSEDENKYNFYKYPIKGVDT